MQKGYIGIDVQLRRPCAFALVDEAGLLKESGWFATADEAVERLRPFADTLALHIGIDAPRMPLPRPREHYWDGAKCSWRPRRPAEKGVGRHCEVAVKALGLGNPQWTPLRNDAPDWMVLGFDLFNRLGALGITYEAFPSASYTQLERDPSVRLSVDFSFMKPGPKDMLDAWVAAATVREYVEGRGMAVGSGDGLGRIILPRPVTADEKDVLRWPG